MYDAPIRGSLLEYYHNVGLQTRMVWLPDSEKFDMLAISTKYWGVMDILQQRSPCYA